MAAFVLALGLGALVFPPAFAFLAFRQVPRGRLSGLVLTLAGAAVLVLILTVAPAFAPMPERAPNETAERVWAVTVAVLVPLSLSLRWVRIKRLGQSPDIGTAERMVVWAVAGLYALALVSGLGLTGIRSL
mgnify:CR=1 FL=1